MKNYVIFGAPGAGKGTQAELMAEKFGLVHLSSGAVLRQEAKKGGLGEKIKKYQAQGRLVPDAMIISLMEKKINRALKKGLILDGYPRTLHQARALDKFLASKKTAIDAVFSLRLSEALALKRVKQRGLSSGRSDDNSQTIINRFAVYHAQTLPLLDYYKKQRKLINIDGRPKINDIFQEIAKKIK